jgi:hypothetical protein
MTRPILAALGILMQLAAATPPAVAQRAERPLTRQQEDVVSQLARRLVATDPSFQLSTAAQAARQCFESALGPDAVARSTTTLTPQEVGFFADCAKAIGYRLSGR